MPTRNQKRVLFTHVRASGLSCGDCAAVLGLILLSLTLFGPHLLGLDTFIGNSDRLNTFLNMRQITVEAWQTMGRVPAWSDAMLLGVPLFGLHWTMLAVDPMPAVAALLPAREVFRAAGYISALHLVSAALAAYLLLRDVVRAPFPAFVGAGLYVCSAFAIHRVAQVDSAFATFILHPLGLLTLRTVRPGRAAMAFLALTGVVAVIVGLTLLQDAVYLLLFFGMYACYRLIAVRDWRPLVVLGAAGLVGIILTSPRLGTVLEDFRELSRSTSIQNTCPCELLRWLDDGIFGRYPEEALALGNAINLSEGVQLYTSTFAAFAVMALLLRPRGGPARLVGMSFLLLLVLLFVPVVGLGPGGLVLLNGIGILILLALARPRIGRLLGQPPSTFVQDPDLRFFILFVLLVFTILLSDAVRYVVYLSFFRVDFSHGRSAVAAVLPLCALAAVFVRELFGGVSDPQARPHQHRLLPFAAGGAVAVVVVLLLDLLAPAVGIALFGAAESVTIGNSYLVSTHAIARVVMTVAVFVVVLGWSWLARHVDLVREAGRLRPCWRGTSPLSEGDGSMPAFWRLVPAYALGGLMLAQAFGDAYVQLNGAHTRTYPVPFVRNNSFSPPADVLVPPGAAARRAVGERLEADAHRSVIVSAPDGYPMYHAPSEHGYAAFVASFWRLRLANGYPVLSRRVAGLPWPDADKTLRGISFRDQNALPWPLLAALNVKYAVVASPPLLFNVPADPARRGADAGPEDLTILENPLPVVPRAFFAAAVAPRSPTVTPPITALPGPPNALRVTALPESIMVVSWNGDVGDATYQVHRRQLAPAPEPTSVQVAHRGRGASLYVESGLTPGATYEYLVRTCDPRGCGELSAPMAGTVATADVAVPRSVTVTPRSATEALVTWDPVDGSASTYLDLLTGAGALVGETVEIPPGTRSYALSGLRPLRDYAVRLRVCSSAGCSPHTAPHLVSMPSSLTAAELDGIIPLDPTTESIVEGLERPLTFGDSTGAIRADYREPDRVRIEVEPADVQRFLVVNELYHPNWRAYATGSGGDTELKVWPTNVVMRGVLIPPGVTEIEMRFEPFMLSWTATSFVIAGLVIGLAAWLALRSLDVAQPARSSGR